MTIDTVIEYQYSEFLCILRIDHHRRTLTLFAVLAAPVGVALLPIPSLELRIGFAAYGVFMAAGREWRLRRAARITTASEGNFPRTIAITQESFISHRGAVTHSLAWSRMHSVCRKGPWWYLHTTEKQFLVFPVRALTDEQHTEFEAFLESRGLGVAA